MAWENGELITATKLNSMENGIGENNMSYEKHTWETGELITADKLNHMEEGIEGGGGGESINPVVTLNIVNNRAADMYLADGRNVVLQNNTIEYQDPTPLSLGEHIIKELIIKNFDDSDTRYVVKNYSTWTGTGFYFPFASDLVNCQTDEYNNIVVTDPTSPASVTLTYESGE